MIFLQDRHCLRLKALASASSETAEYFEKLARNCLMILRSAQRCRLLKPSEDGLCSSASMMLVQPPSTEPFEHFWSRFNGALLEKVLLQRHQAAISRPPAIISSAASLPLCDSKKKRQSKSNLDSAAAEQWIVSGKSLLLVIPPAASRSTAVPTIKEGEEEEDEDDPSSLVD